MLELGHGPTRRDLSDQSTMAARGDAPRGDPRRSSRCWWWGQSWWSKAWSWSGLGGHRQRAW